MVAGLVASQFALKVRLLILKRGSVCLFKISPRHLRRPLLRLRRLPLGLGLRSVGMGQLFTRNLENFARKSRLRLRLRRRLRRLRLRRLRRLPRRRLLLLRPPRIKSVRRTSTLLAVRATARARTGLRILVV